MRYFALATDYDGTLALHSKVDARTIDALERLRATSRKLILVTGRQLDDLQKVFDRLDLFDRVVAENGALLYDPATRKELTLAAPPPPSFSETLRNRGVQPLSSGRVIVATWAPNETTVLETIRDMGLSLEIIFNKGAVMVLPSGVNKAVGLTAALEQLGLSPHNVVGVGDAENDHAFMNLCECSVAVANALETVKERADYTTSADRGAGVVELIDKIIADDLRELAPRLDQRRIVLGTRLDSQGSPASNDTAGSAKEKDAVGSGQLVSIAPYGTNILLTGSSGAGKSTLATAMMERLAEQAYQFCVIDPEGDYQGMDLAMVLGDPERDPSIDAVVELMSQPKQNVIVNLLGIGIEHRPAFFEQLLPRFQEMRARSGRPHWLIIDEAHHMLPTAWRPTPTTLPQEMSGLLLITVHPDMVTPAVLSLVDLVIAIGEAPQTAIEGFSRAIGETIEALEPVTLNPGHALVWTRHTGSDVAPFVMRIDPPKLARRRHLRKYAEGTLGEDKSFYFRGPQGKLNLRAQNLGLFTQIADGIDDETWLHHLQRGDYSSWFREAIKDDGLAEEAQRVESQSGLSPGESRRAIARAIEERYTAPA